MILIRDFLSLFYGYIVTITLIITFLKRLKNLNDINTVILYGLGVFFRSWRALGNPVGYRVGWAIGYSPTLWARAVKIYGPTQPKTQPGPKPTGLARPIKQPISY